MFNSFHQFVYDCRHNSLCFIASHRKTPATGRFLRCRPLFFVPWWGLKSPPFAGFVRFVVSIMMWACEPLLRDFLLKSRKIDTFGLTSSKTKNAYFRRFSLSPTSHPISMTGLQPKNHRPLGRDTNKHLLLFLQI